MTMTGSKNYAEDLVTLIQKIDDLKVTMNRGEHYHKFESVINSYGSIFNRFCPYVIGDRVRLIKAPVINDRVAPGWMGCEHFLIEGALGKITDTGYDEGKFVFGVEFDDDSYIHFQTGEVVPTSPNKRYSFRFSEEDLAVV